MQSMAGEALNVSNQYLLFFSVAAEIVSCRMSGCIESENRSSCLAAFHCIRCEHFEARFTLQAFRTGVPYSCMLCTCVKISGLSVFYLWVRDKVSEFTD